MTTSAVDPYVSLRNLAYQGVHYHPYDWALDEVTEPHIGGFEEHEKTRNITNHNHPCKPANMK
jgi:hypothetical protein